MSDVDTRRCSWCRAFVCSLECVARQRDALRAERDRLRARVAELEKDYETVAVGKAALAASGDGRGGEHG